MKKICIILVLFISGQLLAMQQPQKPALVKISREEGTQGLKKRKYITYSLQSRKTKEYPYKYITHYPDTNEYKVTGELVSDTDQEVYRKIPQQKAEDTFYQYELAAEKKDKVN